MTVGGSRVAVAVGLGGLDGLVGNSGSLLLSGSGLAVSGVVSGVPSVVVLSPLVVIGLDVASVLLVLVGLGVNGVVRLAPSGVGIRTVSLLGPCVVVVSTLLSGSSLGGGLLLDAVGAGVGFAVWLNVALLTVALVVTVALLVTVSLVVTVADVVVGVSLSLSGVTVVVAVTLGGSFAVGGGTVSVTVNTPCLSTVSVVVLVVPFVVRLGIVGLGVGHLVRLVNLEILISAPGVPLGALLVTVHIGLGVGGLGGIRSVSPRISGSGLAVSVGTSGVVSVVVLSPLVVISIDLSGVRLVVVRLGRDGVVGLAPSGVEVGTGGGLGPLVVVVAGCLGGSLLGGTFPFVGTVALLVATVSVVTVALAVRVGGVLVLGGSSTVRGGTVDILV